RAADGAIHQLALEVSNDMNPYPKLPVLIAGAVLTTAIGGLLLAMTPDKPAAKPATPATQRKEPDKTADWKEEFDKIYTLKEGEVVKIIPRADRPACRREFVRARLSWDKVKPDRMDAAVDRDERVKFFVVEVDARGKQVHVWDESGYYEGDEYVGASFRGLTRRLGGFNEYEIEVEKQIDRIRSIELAPLDNPDFIIRKDAPREKLIPALDKELKEKLNAKFQVELKDVEREVWVAGGKLDFKPREWRQAGQVDVYSDEAVVDKEVTYASARPSHLPGVYSDRGGVRLFLKQLSDCLETFVVWGDGDPPVKPVFEWLAHWQEDKTPRERKAHRDPEKVLPIVAEQTGLTFAKEKRKVSVLFISERK
ncbi:MAG: hypothetical protein MUF18_13205, partial [Fimbriiglobus sp.]|nr:hypothetical protein [Fimbriiglobus sp.]